MVEVNKVFTGQTFTELGFTDCTEKAICNAVETKRGSKVVVDRNGELHVFQVIHPEQDLWTYQGPFSEKE
ncbi:hypothetical protein ACFSCX_05860 [Bacillus salitolerans]|uniref:Uncharacterized protein n=1 Tax=Bacillus salitolerans TaxID=1437434 RepID=A0ABW4LMF7_9BACI